MPSSVLHRGIPHAVLYPNRSLFALPPWVFGCVAFVHVLTPGQDKLSHCATKCVFLGYSRTQKGYKCWNPQSSRYVVSADVTCFEGQSFFSSTGTAVDVDVLNIPLLIPPSSVPPPLQVYSCRTRVLPSSSRPKDPPAPPPLSSSSPEIPGSSDLPIALRKGTRSCTQHPLDQVVSYSHLSPSLRSFIRALSSVSIP